MKKSKSERNRNKRKKIEGNKKYGLYEDIHQSISKVVRLNGFFMMMLTRNTYMGNSLVYSG